MEENNLATLRHVKKILEQFDLRPQKRWGQNFLIDQNIVNKILTDADAGPDDYILEIGPGLGVLTLPLAQRSAGIIAIEKDRGLVAYLKELFASFPAVKIIEADVRKLDLGHLVLSEWSDVKPIKIVANLPYYLTSSLIYRVIKGEVPWRKAVLMVQKEVAERITAPVGSSSYGSLTILCRYFTHARQLFNVSRSVFYPTPGVDSAVISLEPRIEKHGSGDEKLYIKLVSGVFQQRRKTILNALGTVFNRPSEEIREALIEAEIDSTRRPESINCEEFANLCRLIYNKNWNRN